MSSEVSMDLIVNGDGIIPGPKQSLLENHFIEPDLRDISLASGLQVGEIVFAELPRFDEAAPHTVGVLSIIGALKQSNALLWVSDRHILFCARVEGKIMVIDRISWQDVFVVEDLSTFGQILITTRGKTTKVKLGFRWDGFNFAKRFRNFWQGKSSFTEVRRCANGLNKAAKWFRNNSK